MTNAQASLMAAATLAASKGDRYTAGDLSSLTVSIAEGLLGWLEDQDATNAITDGK